MCSSRFRFKGKRGAAVDTHIADVPQLHGHDGHLQHTLAAEPPGHALGLILTYAAGQVPYNTWLVKGYLSNIPRSLDEAAKLDGPPTCASSRR